MPNKPLQHVYIDYKAAGADYTARLYVTNTDFLLDATKTPGVTEKEGEELISALIQHARGDDLRGITRLKNNIFNDGPNGEPAEVEFHETGELKKREHRNNGLIQDPADGRAAIQFYYTNGKPSHLMHYQNGKQNDTAAGDPAFMVFNESGVLRHAESFKDGLSKRIFSEQECRAFTPSSEKDKRAQTIAKFGTKLRF